MFFEYLDFFREKMLILFFYFILPHTKLSFLMWTVFFPANHQMNVLHLSLLCILAISKGSQPYLLLLFFIYFPSLKFPIHPCFYNSCSSIAFPSWPSLLPRLPSIIMVVFLYFSFPIFTVRMNNLKMYIGYVKKILSI